MADRTLYDILEISSSASPEAVRAAFERLSGKYDLARPENQDNPSVRVQHDAVRDAFFTLGNPEKRALYDRKLESRGTPPLRNVQVVEPFWTLPKLVVIGLLALIAGGFYFQHSREQARLAAEKAIAEAKAKAAIEKARAEEEQARLETARLRDERAAEAQQRRDREAALRQFQQEQRTQALQDRRQVRTDSVSQRNEEARRRNEEARAAASARQQLARDRAELCRMERERYGRALSC